MHKPSTSRSRNPDPTGMLAPQGVERDPGWRRLRRLALVMLVLAALAGLHVAPAFAEQAEAVAEGAAPQDDDGPGLPPDWARVVEGYTSDPVEYGPQLIALARAEDTTLPPPLQAMLADAYLRAGRPQTAARLFEEVVASGDDAYVTLGNLGLGGSHMMMGDPEAAAGYFEQVASGEEAAAAAGNLGLGHALAASGRPLEAKQAFDAVAENPVVETPMRRGAEFGSASALYAAGEYQAAAAAFDALAASDPEGAIGRDARYAAARARLAAGDRDAGVSGLQRLTASCDDDDAAAGRASRGRGAPRSLRNLDPRAVSRAWLRNYQRTGWKTLFAKSDDSPLYTIGGCGLARATLRQVNTGRFEAAPVQRIAATTRTAPAAAAPPAPEAPGAPGPDAAPQASRDGSSWLTWTILAAALVVVAVVWLRRGRA